MFANKNMCENNTSNTVPVDGVQNKNVESTIAEINEEEVSATTIERSADADATTTEPAGVSIERGTRQRSAYRWWYGLGGVLVIVISASIMQSIMRSNNNKNNTTRLTTPGLAPRSSVVPSPRSSSVNLPTLLGSTPLSPTLFVQRPSRPVLPPAFFVSAPRSSPTTPIGFDPSLRTTSSTTTATRTSTTTMNTTGKNSTAITSRISSEAPTATPMKTSQPHHE